MRPNVDSRGPAADAPRRIHAFWCTIPSRPNFGDALTPWLIRRLTGRHPTFVRPEDRRHKYFVTGSIMSYAGAHCSVWGCGIMNRNDYVSPEAELLAVRGPLTRARALECGADCPEVYGDPALLLPRLYSPRMEGRGLVGVMPHLSDMPRLAGGWRASGELRLIDPQGRVEKVIDQLASCEFVISSSLHGIIASHAYGVPAVWVKFRDLPRGDDSKFHDYFHSIGQEPSPVLLGYDRIDAGELATRASSPAAGFDLELLWQSCPFRGEP